MSYSLSQLSVVNIKCILQLTKKTFYLRATFGIDAPCSQNLGEECGNPSKLGLKKALTSVFTYNNIKLAYFQAKM